MYSVEVSYQIGCVSPKSDVAFDRVLQMPIVCNGDEYVQRTATLNNATVNSKDFDIDVAVDGTISVRARRINIYVDKSNLMLLLFELSLHCVIEYVQERRSKRRVYQRGATTSTISDFEHQVCSFLHTLEAIPPSSL